MNTAPAVRTYAVPERFDKALKAIRIALSDMEVDVVREFRYSATDQADSDAPCAAPRVLLVSSPILEFEALALGRAAAVFFPLHILVADEGEQTRVSVVNPVVLFEGRFPPGAGAPIERLLGRIESAMESLMQSREMRIA